jgi:aldehyde dehydrogenase (NAD+)
MGADLEVAEMADVVASIVGGRPVSGAPGGTRVVPNPAQLDEIVAEAALGDPETFVRACDTARAAQGRWAAVPAPVRGRAIQQLGRLVESNPEALARSITREIGKPIAESRGEVQEVSTPATSSSPRAAGSTG